MSITDLPVELLHIIIKQADSPWMTKLTCKAWRDMAHIEPNDRRYGCYLDICSHAAGYGYIGILEWATARGSRCSNLSCNAAAKHGWLDVLKWIYARCADPVYDVSGSICDYAVSGGYTNILQWLREIGINIDLAAETAALKGRTDVFKWMIMNHQPCRYSIHTVVQRDMSLVEWLIDNEYEDVRDVVRRVGWHYGKKARAIEIKYGLKSEDSV